MSSKNPLFVTTHGMSRTPTYVSWWAMVQRCTYEKHPAYKKYGGAGITVCPEWLVFENFLKDMGERPAGLTLERKDGTLGYSKSNCIWATRQTQNENRSNVVWITYAGETKTASAWSRDLGIPQRTLLRRYRDNWPVERVLGICK